MGTVLDPLADAVQAAESASQYFGKLEIDGQFVILRKGEKKRTWLEGESTDGRVSEITIRLNPLDITGMTRLVERQVLANSGEWSRIVWPSLRDLGVKALREIHGKFAHIALVPSGRTWQNSQGETVTGTTFKFIGLYDLEGDCIKAWEEAAGNKNVPNTSIYGTTPPPPAHPTSDAERAVAAQFLPPLVKAANGDLTALATNLASFELTKKYFTVDSPEVVELLKAA